MAIDCSVDHLAVVGKRKIQQLRARVHSAWSGMENLQQLEFPSREFNIHPIQSHHPTLCIDGQSIGCFRNSIQMGRIAPKYGLCPRDKFSGLKGLAQIIVSAHFQPDKTVYFFDFRSHHNDRNITCLADFATDGQSIHTR